MAASKILGEDTPMEIQRSRSMAQKLTLNETEQLDKNQRDLVQKYGFLQTRFKSKEYESMFRLYKSRHNAQLLSWVALIMVLMAVGQFIIFMATQAFEVIPAVNVFEPIGPCSPANNLTIPTANRTSANKTSANRTSANTDMICPAAISTCPIDSNSMASSPAFGVSLVRWGPAPSLIYLCIMGVLFLVVGVITCADRQASKRRIQVYSWTVVGLLVASVYGLFALRAFHTGSDVVGLMIFVIFSVYTMNPLSLRVSCVICVTLSIFHVILTIVVAAIQDKAPGQFGALDAEHPGVLAREACANIIIFAATNLVGVCYNLISDTAQRKSFSETRRFIRSLIAIGLENKKVDRLLESMLPNSMIRDFKERKLDSLRQTKDKRRAAAFRELDISKATNVSILFADIVGFTRLSSGCTAQDLVKTLNELFGRFDQLAASHNCHRIKILGDCYYCVSGLLGEGPAEEIHADNCVSMGLAMVEAIRDIRYATKVNVDMRVGVHTGNVLYGRMGEKKVQFDVWGNDVTLANHMESGGLPGRVHISEATKSKLVGEFELEDGNGADRDSLLKGCAMKTYLVVDRRLPRKDSIANELDVTQDLINPMARYVEKWGAQLPFGLDEDVMSDMMATDVETDEEEESPVTVYPMTPSRAIYRRKSMAAGQLNLEQDTLRDMNNIIIHRGKKKDAGGDPARAKQIREIASHKALDRISLFYKKWNLNREYTTIPDKYFKFYLYTTLMLFLSIIAVQLITLPKSWPQLGVGVGGLLFFAVVVPVYSFHLCRRYKKNVDGQPFILVRISLWFIKNPFARGAVFFISLLFVFAIAPVGLAECASCSRCNCTFGGVGCNCTDWDTWSTALQSPEPDTSCQLPEYFLLSFELALLATVVFVRMNWISKIVITLLTATILYIVILIAHPCIMDNRDRVVHGLCTPSKLYFPLKVEYLVYLARITFAVLVLARYNETANRLAFLYRVKSREEKENRKSTEEISVLLLRNILPDHVAQHYIENGQQGAELYSESHENVCVMFASIYGWDDYYDQTGINDSGMECLRLLNEIMWDFDEILERPRYACIEKIKAIGHTYMAAAGLGGDNGPAAGRRMNHIGVMTDFAFEMIKKLNRINEHAFTEFQLKIGINYGPVVAGVIGATKPLYDIWGDTVNVSSRMYSTGEPGRIQVTEETARALEACNFQVEERGKVFVKGKGELTTFFVLGRGGTLGRM